MHWFELGLLDLVHQRQVRVDGTAHAVGVRELVGDAVALAPDRGDEVLARDQALDFVAEGQLVRRVGLLARRPRVELAPEQGQDLVGRHDEALLDLCGNQPVRRVHAAVLARSSGEEPASPRHRAGVASMAWSGGRHDDSARTRRKF